jgi:hypothetical protein
MRKQLLTIAAFGMLIAAALPGTALGAVAGPSSAMQRAAQAIDMTEEVRRVCTRQLRCKRMFQCRWERVCRFTRDYPTRPRR